MKGYLRRLADLKRHVRTEACVAVQHREYNPRTRSQHREAITRTRSHHPESNPLTLSQHREASPRKQKLNDVNPEYSRDSHGSKEDFSDEFFNSGNEEDVAPHPRSGPIVFYRSDDRSEE